MGFWKHEGNPNNHGWHAVLVCYDSQEGAFPQGSYWDGSAWDRKAVVAWGERCSTKQQAEDLAYENDPDA